MTDTAWPGELHAVVVDGETTIADRAGTASSGGVLAVDLDGTLLRSDLLHESFWSSIASRWTALPEALLALRGGKAGLKHALTRRAQLDFGTLPYNQTVIDYIRSWGAAGGRAVLVTASNIALAEPIAAHLGIFDEVHGSNETLNLKGPAKARFLTERFGERGFAYAGDHPADLSVWSHANRVITVSDSAALRRKAEALGLPTDHLSGSGAQPRAYLRAMRPHQWLKNLLIFVPVFASHHLALLPFAQSLLALIAFSLTASSVYVINDLLDLKADRAHPRKRRRPLASGDIPIAHGSALGLGLWLAGLGVAATLGLRFLLVVVGYYAATSAYSLLLKRKPIIDICMLAGLYTIRILAGSVATAIPVSVWLFAFSIFFFLSLAAVKRQAELVSGIASGALKVVGRGYARDDLSVVSQMAIAAGYVSVLVLALYLNSPAVLPLYHHASYLWGVCLILLYWISRIAMLGARGLMHDDPLVFAFTDRISQVCGVLAGVCFVTAAVL